MDYNNFRTPIRKSDSIECELPAIVRCSLKRVSRPRRNSRPARKRCREKLQVAAVLDSSSTARRDGAVRYLHLVPYVHNDRYPIDGHLTVDWGTQRISRAISAADYQQQCMRVELLEQEAPCNVHVVFETNLGKVLEADFQLTPESRLPWRQHVRNCLDTLIEHVRDDDGRTRSPCEPTLLDALMRLEDRLHRCAERGSNCWYDQALLRCLYRMSELSGDEGYKSAADESINNFFQNCCKDRSPDQVYLNGMPAWGSHVYWDCYHDESAGDGDGNGPHKILVYRAEWEAM